MNVQKGKHAEEIWAAIHLEIISSGLAQLDPSWADISIHPPYSRLYYIADGNGYVESSKQHLTLKKGYVYLLPAGTTLQYRCPEQMKQLYFHIEAKTSDGYDLFSRTETLAELPFLHDIDTVCQNYLSGDYLQEMMVRCQIETDVSRFAAKLGLEETLLRPCSPFLQAVFRIVHTELSSSLTIRKIANMLSMSESALTKRFRLEFGMPIGRYIDEMLTQEIARKLLMTQHSIREIAEQLGFCDQFYLSRFFHAHKGMSPSIYRSKMQQQI